MIRLIRFELVKLMSQSRTIVSLGLMLILVSLIFWGVKSEGGNAINYLIQTLGKNFIISGNVLNGYLVLYFILNTLWIHVPILIVIVTGDLFSSELENGTIRLVLTRPIKRYHFALSKLLTAVIFVLIFMLFWALISVWPAFLLFGRGDLVVVFSSIQIISENELFGRFLPAYGYAFLGMSAFALFSVTISFFIRRSLITILVALGVIVISTLLQTLASSLFQGWESFLLTYHLSQWQLFFHTDFNQSAINHSIFWLLIFSFVCIIISIVRFNRLKITE